MNYIISPLGVVGEHDFLRFDRLFNLIGQIQSWGLESKALASFNTNTLLSQMSYAFISMEDHLKILGQILVCIRCSILTRSVCYV